MVTERREVERSCEADNDGRWNAVVPRAAAQRSKKDILMVALMLIRAVYGVAKGRRIKSHGCHQLLRMTL